MRQNPRCIFRALADLLLGPLEGMARVVKHCEAAP
jgi:hypothetical protein